MPAHNIKPTVIAVGLFIPGTGFTRVFQSMFAELHKWFHIHWLGIAYRGPVKITDHYTLYPNNIHGGDAYGAYRAADMAKELNADFVLLLNDLYQLKNYSDPFMALKKNACRLVVYAPLDGEITDTSIVQEFLYPDELVLYTEWAKEELRKCFTENSLPSPHLSVAYHGVDSSFFQKPQNKTEQNQIKKELFGHDDAADAIFILNANRFNERKDIASTIEGFGKAGKQFNHPAYLVLHAPNMNEIQNQTLHHLIEDSGLKEKILLNPVGNEYVSDEDLRKLYQSCAIGVNTSIGEGWGLVGFEHACCGAAQIVPGHGTLLEIWQQAAFFLPLSHRVKLDTNPFDMYSTDTTVLAETLSVFVNEPCILHEVSARCYRHAREKKFTWEFIAEQWRSILKNP